MKKFKEYLYSLRYFILVAVLVFAFAVYNGFYIAQTSPQETEMVLKQIKEIYEPVFEMSPFGQFFFVMLNNGLTLFFTLLLGVIFGIFPFLVLFSNGTILGIMAFSAKLTFSWSMFFLGTLPHGIVEIPVLILAGAMGLKIGKRVFQRVFKKEGEIKKELFTAFDFFLKVLLPLLALAAAIEIFITAQILGI